MSSHAGPGSFDTFNSLAPARLAAGYTGEAGRSPRPASRPEVRQELTFEGITRRNGRSRNNAFSVRRVNSLSAFSSILHRHQHMSRVQVVPAWVGHGAVPLPEMGRRVLAMPRPGAPGLPAGGIHPRRAVCPFRQFSPRPGKTGCPAGASDRRADHPAHLGGMSGGGPPLDFPDRCPNAGLLNWELCYLVLSQSMGESHLMPRLEVCTGVLRMSGSELPLDGRAFERGFLHPCPRC